MNRYIYKYSNGEEKELFSCYTACVGEREKTVEGNKFEVVDFISPSDYPGANHDIILKEIH